MTMATFAVYDTGTGEVVHVHVEPAGLDTSPEEILQLADPGRARSLDVVRVPEGPPGQAARVVDGEMRPAGDDVAAGAAGGGGGVVEPAVERRYEVRRPGGGAGGSSAT
jgi:hypothetical protein